MYNFRQLAGGSYDAQSRRKGERLVTNHERWLKDNNGGKGKAVQKPGQRIVGGGGGRSRRSGNNNMKQLISRKSVVKKKSFKAKRKL